MNEFALPSAVRKGHCVKGGKIAIGNIQCKLDAIAAMLQREPRQKDKQFHTDTFTPQSPHSTFKWGDQGMRLGAKTSELAVGIQTKDRLVGPGEVSKSVWNWCKFTAIVRRVTNRGGDRGAADIPMEFN